MKFPLANNMIKTLTTGILVLTMFVGFLPPAAKAQKAAGPSPEANPNIDQCQNGPASAALLPCGPNWTNGALTPNDSQYSEDQSVSFRVSYTGLTPGTRYFLTIDYDTTKGGKHAYDYITDYDRVPNTNPTNSNNPCGTGADVVAGCVWPENQGVTSDELPIPVDPRVTAGQDQILGNGDDIVQIPGSITFFGTSQLAGPADDLRVEVPVGNTFNGYVLSGTYAGDSNTSLQISFVAGPSNVPGGTTTVVFAWGGHIAKRLDWGPLNSAINIQGRPYHMSLGNQELQTDVGPSAFPAIITIVKQVEIPTLHDCTIQSTFPFQFSQSGAAVFGLEASPADSAFPVLLRDLYMDCAPANPPTITREDMVRFRTNQYTNGIATIDISEVLPGGSGFQLLSISCVDTDGGLGTSVPDSVQFNATTARIMAQEAEFVTCKFINNRVTVTAGGANVTGQVVNSNGAGIRNAVLTATNGTTGTVYRARTNGFGYYSLLDLPVGDVYFVTIHSKTYTFANPTQTFTLNEDIAGIDFTANP